jgi:hypothetical protein
LLPHRGRQAGRQADGRTDRRIGRWEGRQDRQTETHRGRARNRARRRWSSIRRPFARAQPRVINPLLWHGIQPRHAHLVALRRIVQGNARVVPAGREGGRETQR